MKTLWEDIRYGLRMLAKAPGFTLVAVLTLALGIGANTAIFSVVSAVLLRSLPFSLPNELVRVVSVRARDNAPDNASYPDFKDWRAQSHSFSQMAAYRTESFTLTGQGDPAHIEGAVVSAELFPLLRVQPLLGRTFLPEEDTPGAGPTGLAVILSHGLWRQHFGADPAIVGRTIDLDNRSFTVVGVMPAGFQFPIQSGPIDFWTTIAVDLVEMQGEKPMASQRGAHYLDVIGRLKPEFSPSQAQAELATIVSNLNKQYTDNAPRTIWVVPELRQLVSGVRPALLILLGAVGCVLLIACANVGNLLLSRGVARQREMTVRGALGASRWRMIRQLLTESIMLGLAGGALGVTLALWGIPPLVRLVPEDVPRIAEIRLNAPVLLFTLALSLLTGILFGLAPALRLSRARFLESLKEGGRGALEGQHGSRLRSVLVVCDVAVAAILLVGAGLLIKSFLRLERVDPGYDPHRVLTFKVDLPDSTYTKERQAAFYQQALARLNQLPGVHSASAVLPLPLDGDEVDTLLELEGQPLDRSNPLRTNYTWVEPGYFGTVGIRLREGRDFNDRDNLATSPVVIVNETIARRYFPGQDPIGKRIRPHIGNGYPTPPMREIVGVVGDVKQTDLTTETGPQVYVPRSQSPFVGMIFVVRTEVAPLSILGAARKQISEIDKDLPIYDVKTLDQYFAQSVGQPHFFTTLLGIFAVLALLLAAVGLYGVISHSAAQRTHEIGLRMALGANKRDVLTLVVGQGFKLTLIGVAIGVAGALALTRLLSTLLYDVQPTDPATFVLVSLLLVFVALLACYIPARRATRVDPMVALRYE
jgi:putative ABC transport system permease protein